MAFTVQTFIDLPIIRSARPEVIAGENLGGRQVRWVHTSEIYEISALLRGGEVLLTTGLGLVGMSPEAMSHYVERLAERQIAALVLEVGRTFTRAPQELGEVATAHGLPLILLHGVVPFIEVTETVHPMLIAEEIDELRRVDAAWTELTQVMVRAHGLQDVMRSVEQVVGAPAGLYAIDETLIAGRGIDAETVTRVEVGEGPWATLRIAAEPQPVMLRLAELSANAINISVANAAHSGGGRSTERSRLLHDIAAGRCVSSSEITERAAAAGFVVRPGHRVLGLVLDTTKLASMHAGLDATTEAFRAIFDSSLAAEVDGEILVAVTVGPSDLRLRLAESADAVDAELRATVGGRVTRLTAGPLVQNVAGLARSIPVARDAAQLARSLSLSSRIVLAPDLGVYSLLSRLVDDSDLERFIDEQLGPLLEQDARQASELVRTLDAFLEAGLSKTLAAATLGIRRQTIYGRLERISHLLGGISFNDRQRRTALDLALVSWRIRTSAATHRLNA